MTDLRETIVEMITDICRPDPVDLSDHSRPLFECGLDSLDFASVLMAIEDRFGMTLSEQDLEQVSTVDKIVHYLAPHSRT